MIRWHDAMLKRIPSTKCKTIKELLKQLYWKEEMSSMQIADLLGVSHMSILTKMNQLKIPRRGKGGSNNPTGRQGKTDSPESLDSVARFEKFHQQT